MTCFRVKFNFWHKLADEDNEEDIVGESPVGTAHADFNKFGDPAWWRDTWQQTDTGSRVIGIDFESPPTFFVERIGMVMHWRITVDVIGIRG